MYFHGITTLNVQPNGMKTSPLSNTQSLSVEITQAKIFTDAYMAILTNTRVLNVCLNLIDKTEKRFLFKSSFSL